MILQELEKLLFIDKHLLLPCCKHIFIGLGGKSIFVDDLLEYYSIYCVWSPSIYGKYGHTALSGNI